jgi:hypothetical protein
MTKPLEEPRCSKQWSFFAVRAVLQYKFFSFIALLIGMIGFTFKSIRNVERSKRERETKRETH